MVTAKKTLADYEVDIPQVAALLADDAKLLAFFTSLTTGYQREWARYIFGAKAETTKQKHIAAMRTVLGAGYKSKRGYASAMKLAERRQG